MKNNFFLIFLSFFFACNTSETVTPTTNTTGNTAGYTLQAIPNSTLQYAEKRGENGQLLEQGMFDNTEKVGNWITFHPESNIPKTQASMAANVLNGMYLEYNKRGQIELVANYLNNQLNGTYTKYKFGRIVEESTYKMGKLDGVFRSYFNNSDKLQREIEYTDGKQNGFWRAYNEEGQVVMEYVYKDGEKVSGGMVKN